MDDQTPKPPTPSGLAVLGDLLRSASTLPRSASTDALGTQTLHQSDARALQSPELRQGLAAWAASLRHPEDPEARAEDAARWEALLTDPLGQQLLVGAGLPAEQRLANVAFLLAQPEPRLDLLRASEGDLTRYAVHALLLAMEALDPSVVAPIVGVPAILLEHLPEFPGAERPEHVGALASLIPDPLPPSRAADALVLLADGLERLLTESPSGEDPIALTLAALLAELPTARGALTPLVEAAATGLRTRAMDIRADPEDPQRVAQALVLGGTQHQLFTLGLLTLAGVLQAQARGDAEAPRLAEETRRRMAASGAAFTGKMLASDVGAAVSGMLSQAAETRWATRLAAGHLPLGEPVLRAPGFSAPGLAAAPLGEATGELLRLYTSQLGDLGDEAFALLGEELVGQLTSGRQEGLDEGWAALLGDLARMAALQDASPDVRAQLLRVLVVGGVVGLLNWEPLAPALHARGPVFFGRTLAVEAAHGPLPEVYRASAALAVTALADPFLREELSGGTLAPEQAVAQVRARGESLLVDGRAPVDAALASALLAAMVPGTRAA
jgi:hypothetical protein